MKKLINAGKAATANLLAAGAVDLKAGDRAPAFTAHTTRGEFTLAALLRRGPLVLAFYPADFTPG